MKFTESGTSNVSSAGGVVLQGYEAIINATPRTGTWLLAGPRREERVAVDLTSVRFRGRQVSYDLPEKPVSSLNWVLTIQSGDVAHASKEHLVLMVQGMNDLLRQQNFDTVDLVLRSMNPAALGPELLVGLVRITSAVRSKLPGWAGFLKVVRGELQSRNLNVATLLKGLPAA